MEEDPAFYRQFSELLEEAIRDYLTNVVELASRMARKDHGRQVPESIKGDEDAQAVFGIIEPVLKVTANGSSGDEDAADIAWTVVGIIKRCRAGEISGMDMKIIQLPYGDGRSKARHQGSRRRHLARQLHAL